LVIHNYLMLYKKVILKLSGETLSGPDFFGFDFKKIDLIAQEIKIFQEKKIKLAIVIGAGNLFRARMLKGKELDRVDADYMGMLATNLNGLALYNYFQKVKIKSQVLSEIPVKGLVEKFSVQKAQACWKKNQILIFAGGTGKPYFTTDTCALLKAKEMKANMVLKATQVNGVYDKDPEKYKGAKMYKEISYQEALKQNLKVMDKEAFQIAQKNKIPIRVLKWKRGNLQKAVEGKNLGTLVN
jgi:uridylate kinase